MAKSTWVARGLLAALLVALGYSGGFWGLAQAEKPVPTTSTAPATTRSTGPLSALAALPAAKDHPATLEDLRNIEKRVQAVVKQSMPAVVGLMMDGGQGSGVIVKADGTILTAGHVSAEPGQELWVILSDGSRVKGQSLGSNNGIDSGMVKITDKPKNGEWPHVEIGASRALTSGQWVIAMGHPGGFHRGRPPVVRLGRVLLANRQMIGTDCPLIGGDSGGPLFDLDGKLVGIHSRIGATTTTNIHVPVDTFVATWDRLAAGEMWGGRSMDMPAGGDGRNASRPALGVTAIDDDNGAKVAKLTPDGPAEKAGLKEGDVIQKVNGFTVKNTQELVDAIARRRPGEQVRIELIRADKPVEVAVKLGRRGL
jgi:serine protease Do